ncbi:hypothetical protein QR680_007314 [Steinernema hermaphroditum]|uniref:RNA polymerase III subunit Rpc25 domain-containing protein n=1 Tax=Steinernema hermaphroditum TaxID=289476 RepID=A0AA39ICT1_9BILA|nr:hypothetical protein QR680_007314 [Steinernema hermaphroditum]
MFILSTIKDTIQSKPHQFQGDYEERLTTAINNRYANKVIPNVGLAMNLYDFVDIGEAHILPGDGCTYTQVTFRLVVFRPFIGQVLEGVVLSSSKEGVYITLDFFDDIKVPPSRLPQNSRFDQNEQSWYWAYQPSPEDEETRLFMDPGKRVRFRVVKEVFNDVQPGEEDSSKKSYELEASMAENGLGCMLWWVTSDVEVEDEEEDEAMAE